MRATLVSLRIPHGYIRLYADPACRIRRRRRALGDPRANLPRRRDLPDPARREPRGGARLLALPRPRGLRAGGRRRGSWHLFPAGEPAGQRRACRKLRLRHRARRARPGCGPQDVRTLARTSARDGIFGDAVQFRRKHERERGEALAELRLQDRRAASRRVRASEARLRRCAGDVSETVISTFLLLLSFFSVITGPSRPASGKRAVARTSPGNP